MLQELKQQNLHIYLIYSKHVQVSVKLCDEQQNIPVPFFEINKNADNVQKGDVIGYLYVVDNESEIPENMMALFLPSDTKKNSFEILSDRISALEKNNGTLTKSLARSKVRELILLVGQFERRDKEASSTKSS